MNSIFFLNDPLRGAEYFGEAAKISIEFGEAEESAARARLACHYAGIAMTALPASAERSEG